MAGLDPAIHVFVAQKRKQDVDARHKAGHDGECVNNPQVIASQRVARMRAR
jgi:hypothetical protein